MHDCKGRKIDKGDWVKTRDPLQTYGEKPDKYVVAKVADFYEGSETCNLGLHHFETRLGQTSGTAKECEVVLKHDGSDPACGEPKA